MKIDTFSQVWGIKRVFYHIQKLKLPFPISITELILAASLEFIMIVLFRHLPIPFIFKFVMIPFGATWALSRMELEERAPHLFVMSLINYATRPKLTSKGKVVAKERTYRVTQVTKILWDGVDDESAGRNT